ncbi:MAG: DUF2271 domain-containing protein [Bacteroidota bacterium]
MNKFKIALCLFICLFIFLSFRLANEKNISTKYKCMVQLVNYTGEGAYVAISLLDANDNYFKTLRILGDEEEWYPDLTDWWSYHTGAKKPSLDAVTGATLAGGERSVFVVEIENELLDAGHKIRFETAVEDQKYVKEDLQFPLTSENVNGKFEGTGYIRYVRIIPSN